MVEDEILNVTYDDGKWSKPYFDCGGGNIWMMTYTVPFFGYNGTYYFKYALSTTTLHLSGFSYDAFLRFHSFNVLS
jgi:hypothetical protein